jgi:ABC-type nitrate/sulfonate/bicarbonate transport system substrate-binding protein
MREELGRMYVHRRRIVAVLAASVIAAAAFAAAASAARGAAASAATIKIGYTGPWSVDYLPTIVAISKLKAMGYKIDAVPFSDQDTEAQASARGLIDIGSTSAGSVLAAIAAGLKQKIFLGFEWHTFVMAAKSEFSTCQSLSLKRVGVESRDGTTGTLTAQWFAKACPSAKPNIVVLPNTVNRVAALINGQLDAAAIDLGGWASLSQEKPGQFRLIKSFASRPIVDSVFYASPSFMNANPKFMRAFVKVYLNAVKQGYKTPTTLLKAGKLIPNQKPGAVKQGLQAYLTNGVFERNGGLTLNILKHTIAFYRPSLKLTGLTAQGVVDLRWLHGA